MITTNHSSYGYGSMTMSQKRYIIRDWYILICHKHYISKYGIEFTIQTGLLKNLKINLFYGQSSLFIDIGKKFKPNSGSVSV